MFFKRLTLPSLIAITLGISSAAAITTAPSTSPNSKAATVNTTQQPASSELATEFLTKIRFNNAGPLIRFLDQKGHHLNTKTLQKGLAEAAQHSLNTATDVLAKHPRSAQLFRSYKINKKFAKIALNPKSINALYNLLNNHTYRRNLSPKVITTVLIEALKKDYALAAILIVAFTVTLAYNPTIHAYKVLSSTVPGLKEHLEQEHPTLIEIALGRTNKAIEEALTIRHAKSLKTILANETIRGNIPEGIITYLADAPTPEDDQEVATITASTIKTADPKTMDAVVKKQEVALQKTHDCTDWLAWKPEPTKATVPA